MDPDCYGLPATRVWRRAGRFFGDDRKRQPAIAAQHGGHDGAADRVARQPPLQAVDVGDRLVVERDDDIAASDAGERRRRTGLDGLDAHARVAGQIEMADIAPRQRQRLPADAKPRAPNAPVPDAGLWSPFTLGTRARSRPTPRLIALVFLPA